MPRPLATQPQCCGERMEHLGSGVWQCDPCGCLLTIRDGSAPDRRRCPDHRESR